MIQNSRIKEIVSNLVDGTDLFIVEITVKRGNVILVHVDSMRGVSIDECVTLSKAIEASLNRDEEDFELEVSSAGLTLPFKVVQQYFKNIGREVEVLNNKGQKFTGKLLAVNSDSFSVEIQRKTKLEGKKKPEMITEQQQFKFDEVKSTKVVINF